MMYTIAGCAIALAYLYFCMRYISKHEEQMPNSTDMLKWGEAPLAESLAFTDYMRVWQNEFVPTIKPHNVEKGIIYLQTAKAFASDHEKHETSSPLSLEAYRRLTRTLASSTAQASGRRGRSVLN